jgi:hypothetical protein
MIFFAAADALSADANQSSSRRALPRQKWLKRFNGIVPPDRAAT